mmetsp:Transcript_3827/g.8347  ORF Transcript_3827/g.8347 Transcript_3827/m.8347 type:complete len:260 (-) Transcript_3827:72-851(-)|eukprot:CAMPEP_0201118180 /NCGR_PEP_ID=MMETSP0850-20130426/2300_1 /ASSEMBLY_ACC=CAM_ASM_000622 /TAXON_ID=183588 /ORGANISM="Pseudo-nitzschia fraudulenta, Strain WWA7" /LENGTH=259 /DNA_ID=CAMNT_0047383173 /DNA_START=34 /DNA_END=813 /DNA_ORIENTATION=+
MTAAAAEGTPLHTAYSFSFMRRGKSNKSEEGNPAAATASGEKPAEEKQEAPATTPHPYENSIKSISTVKTVEQFWSTYNYLKRPNDLSSTTDYHFFRDGIKPTWEDPKNAKGGKWIIRLPKGLASRYWEEVVLALIGGQFPGIPDGEICGLVISIRYSEDILGVWNRSASDRDMVDRLRDAVKKVLQLPPSAYASMEYKPHQNAIADRSSFRNANSHWKNNRQVSETSLSSSSRHRSGSWVEREHSKPSSRRDSDRAWR